MRLLLDSHTFLWIVGDDPRLSAKVRLLVSDSANLLLLSPVSAWEIAAKERRGRLQLPQSPSNSIRALISAGWMDTLPLLVEHAVLSAELPQIHLDPMDRLLIAQSRIEGIPLVTNDALIRQYDLETIW